MQNYKKKLFFEIYFRYIRIYMNLILLILNKIKIQTNKYFIKSIPYLCLSNLFIQSIFFTYKSNFLEGQTCIFIFLTF